MVSFPADPKNRGLYHHLVVKYGIQSLENNSNLVLFPQLSGGRLDPAVWAVCSCFYYHKFLNINFLMFIFC